MNVPGESWGARRLRRRGTRANAFGWSQSLSHVLNYALQLPLSHAFDFRSSQPKQTLILTLCLYLFLSFFARQVLPFKSNPPNYYYYYYFQIVWYFNGPQVSPQFLLLYGACFMDPKFIWRTYSLLLMTFMHNIKLFMGFFFILLCIDNFFYKFQVVSNISSTKK